MKCLANIALLSLLTFAYGRQGIGPGEEEWGYISVRPGANMFYWLFQTLNPDTTRPLVIWLQGLSGSSSTAQGNFLEIGVLNENLQENVNSWVKEVNVLFIDCPVGVGFSYVDDLSLLATSNQEIGSDLVNLITEFLNLYPALRSNPIYIFSEEYGSKMAVEFAVQLNSAISSGSIVATLGGVALGNPWISPLDSINSWAAYLLNLAVVDYVGFNAISQAAQSTINAIVLEDYTLAVQLYQDTLKTIENVTQAVNIDNILYPQPWPLKHSKKDNKFGVKTQSQKVLDLSSLMNGAVSSALQLTTPWNGQSSDAVNALATDFLKSAVTQVETLLSSGVDVTIYIGQLDLFGTTVGSLTWIENLNWGGANSWSATSRTSLSLNSYVEAYYKATNQFSVYWVKRAGQMVPRDNPLTGLELLRRITGI